MSKWKPGDMPTSVEQYGIHNAIWTDLDLAKWMVFAFLVGLTIGWLI